MQVKTTTIGKVWAPTTGGGTPPPPHAPGLPGAHVPGAPGW